MKESYLPTQTWPRLQIPPKITITPDQQHLLLIASAIAGIKEAAQNEDYEKVAEFVETFQNAVKSMNNLPYTSRRLSTISEEPHFDSMILSNSIEPPRAKVSVVSCMRKDENGKSISLPYFVEEKDVEEPVWIRIVPHICLTALCITYMALGALMFKFLDPHVEKHPYHTCLMLSFQICFTVEWGNLPDEAEITKLLCIPYATIGIPLMFSTLSNYGRFLADGFCIYGVFSSSKPRMSIEQKRKQIPIRSAFHLLTAHQLIGIILFNTVYGKLGAVKAWYFIWSTITMISLGDIPFHPTNLLQTIVLILYFIIGNIFVQAILISICYQLQAIFLVRLKFLLFKFHKIILQNDKIEINKLNK